MNRIGAGTGAEMFLESAPRSDFGPLGAEILRNLVVTTIYVLTGYAGLQLAFVGQSVTLFWPPSGIAFAALWLGGQRLVPGIVTGAFLVNLITIHTPGLAALVAVGNSLSAVAAVHFVGRAVRRHPGTGELPRVLWFILIGVLGCTTISATIGTFAIAILHHVGGSIQSTWLVWWMGDAMGVLIVAPPILLWRRTVAGGYRWRDVIDAIGFAIMGFGIIAGLAFIHNPIWAVELCKLFTLLLSLWAGARFGLNGPAAMTLLMAAGAIGVTLLGVGPFARGSFYDSFALVHSYLFAEAVAGMMLAAALADLRRAVAREHFALEAVEAASANRIRLLTMISHDVRTPLSGVMGIMQTLQRSPLPAEQRRLVGLGLRAGNTITKLIADILDVARIDVGQIDLDPAPFDPASSLADIVDLHRDVAGAKGLALMLDLDPLLPGQVMGDRIRFEQLIGNLVDNAISYTPTGSVTITAMWTGQLTIDVIDTGPGIDQDLEPQLFDAFVRAPSSGSAGLGLGLHICQRLAEQMGGNLDYRRGTAGGSHFRVALPLPMIDAPASIRPMTIRESPLAILLIDDDEIACEATGALLKSFGHEVTFVRYAESAIEFLRYQVFDLVLVDIQLHRGGMSGLDFARAVRAMPTLAGKTVIVALTGDGLEDNHRGYLAAGIDGVLVKPLAMTSGISALVVVARDRSAITLYGRD